MSDDKQNTVVTAGPATVRLKRVSLTGGRLLTNLLSRANEGAVRVHAIWYNTKLIEQMDPNHPFHGLAPVNSHFAAVPRKRVNELTVDEVEELNKTYGIKVRYDKNERRDLFNASFRPQNELVNTDLRAAGKNRVSVLAVLQILADQFDEESSIEEIEVNLRAVKVNKSANGKRLRKMLCRGIHFGWMCGETTHGEDATNNPDFILFDDLSAEKQEYDEVIMLAVVDWILEEISKIHTTSKL